MPYFSKSHSVLLVIFFSMLAPSAFGARSELDSLLLVLDKEIANDSYRVDRERRIDEIRLRLAETTDDDRRFALNEEMIGYFSNYQSDSLLAYLDKNIELAKKLGYVEAFNRTTITKSYVLTILRVFYEALEALNTIDPATLEQQNLVPYYETATNLYQYLGFETRDKQNKANLDSMYLSYNDSLRANLPPESLLAHRIMIDSISEKGDNAQALALMQKLASELTPEDPSYAYMQFNLAMLYNANNMPDERDAALARSALCDLRKCTFDNAAIGTLASNLVGRNELSRANAYIRRAVNDANAFNSSYRRSQLSPTVASIEVSYQNNLNNRHRRLIYLCVFALIAVVIISVFSSCLYKAVKRKHALNALLREAYDKEREMNCKLTEANTIKEECIHSFLDNSVDNLNTLEQYRMMIHTKLVNKQYTELAQLVKTNSFARREVDDFYRNFDRVVLRIFPSFVQSFNQLLRPDSRIEPKQEDSLTPELRIFALFRLGVDNPADIAKLLRYSLSTIYNYRVKVRKNAREDINPDDFEAMVMKIGTI